MSDADQPLSPEEVAEVLGVAVGDEPLELLPTAEPPPVPWVLRFARTVGVLFVCLALVLINGLFAGMRGGLAGGLFAITVLVGYAALIPWAATENRRKLVPWTYHGDPRLLVDSFGLTAEVPRRRKPIRLAWPAIAGLTPIYGGVGSDGYRSVERWSVTGESGQQLWFDAASPGADRVVETIRHVLAARTQGRRLWDPASVPDTSLSRLSGPVEEHVDTGLSRVER